MQGPRATGKKESESMAVRLGLTCAAAMVAEASTFPIDTAKTRVQLHISSSSSSKTSANAICSSSSSSVKALSQVIARHGFWAIYRGLPPALLRHAFYTPIRITSYENLRHWIQNSSHQNPPPLLAKALIGGLSGVFGQVVASPADLLKVRMQAGGPADASKIWRNEGFRGLWRGVVPNAQRAFLVNMGELTCYDHAKSLIIRYRVCKGDNVYAHSLASMASALCSTALSCPADVVKTRLMNQDQRQRQANNKSVVYVGSLDCVVKTVQREGILALWKGFFPTLARLGPWQFVFWVSYERFRSLAGISSF